MHELSVCRALLEEVKILAERRETQRVTSIKLRIGPLAGVEIDLLQAAYPAACAGTIADGATLHIEQAPLRVRCDSCGAETDASTSRLVCGACNDWHTTLISGDELLLVGVELME